MAATLDAELVDTLAAAAGGDEAAFTRIVETYDDEMFRICLAMCRDRAIATDAVQSAWALAWRKLRNVREPARLRSWLVAIAVNEAKTLLRRRTRRSEVEVKTDLSMHAAGPDPAGAVGSVDLAIALDRLEPEDRALLALRYVAGFNATELAEVFGLSPPGLRRRLQRLLARLRTELDDG